MNFLAHIFLSGDDDEITIGNFIADSIRGNNYTHLPEKVQKGITLHRAIDTFTDAHPTFRKSTKRLHPNYSHYSGVIVDVYYDHFLAKNWLDYSDTPLKIFTENFYSLLEKNYEILPPRTKRMMPFMIKDNWLFNYAKLEGISGVLRGLNQRTGNKSKMNLAIVDLKEHYTEFENEFSIFFEDLMVHTQEKFIELTKE
ncbi:acyl carrier protein phosphodiesterase [Arenibacter latericius]|uniref:acyl carrier protein phosphodiesterase n=1 Tax=Arenibacter latericius TaxID=86104 RepID=UPI000415855E|nr:acyl carrier protein phosphodiesterase [Arenibacter latericius]MDX1362979.1 acyl carrier protein phosphodiesterase [Arenibacter latericius]